MKYINYLIDLDGVLVNTDDIQYITIKEALYDILKIDISEKDIINNIFKSTIPTMEKLELLSNYYIIDENKINEIYNLKKIKANSYFNKLTYDNEKINLMKFLKEKLCKIAVVTNGNRNSAEIILKNIGIFEYIDLLITNEDVKNKKPYPDPYLKAISDLNITIENTIIFEDSEIGIESAKNTGCKYYKVNNYEDINIKKIKEINNL